MSEPNPDSRTVATLVAIGFRSYRQQFQSSTRRAAQRFESRDWVSLARDNRERSEAYDVVLSSTIQAVLDSGYDQGDVSSWTGAMNIYRDEHLNDTHHEIAETFFNSVARRLFETEGINPDLEFLSPAEAASRNSRRPTLRVYDHPSSSAALLEGLLRDCRFHARWRDKSRDIDRAVELLGAVPDRVEVIDQLFYRSKGAYLVGRLIHGTSATPFALAIRHGPSGLRLAAVLVGDRDISILFSYTRSSFLVYNESPAALVSFLSELLPWRKSSEIYASIGFRKQSKTERYRDLTHYLSTSTDTFEYAPGIRGLVMIVFTLPGYDAVFKVIRDHFPPQKNVTPAAVAMRYKQVARHDRAGRLVEALRFVDLRLPRERFDPDVLQELLTEASRTVRLVGDTVLIGTVYVERRVIPLDVYVGAAEPQEAARAIIDYGTAIKNLAATNIFPGDMLLKNFGVTSRGRIVFYDYDEIAELTSCKFRRFPEVPDDMDGLSSTQAFGVGPNDVFPEELPRFLGLSPELREAFDSQHADLFDVDFWQNVQKRIEAGEIIEILPYRQSRSLE